MFKKINDLTPSNNKSADYGPVTLVIAPLEFYSNPNTAKQAEIRQELQLKTSDAFIQAFWYFHDYSLMQAFIIGSNFNTYCSIEEIDTTIGRAIKAVYFVHMISPSTNTPALSTGGQVRLVTPVVIQIFSEALEHAKKTNQ